MPDCHAELFHFPSFDRRKIEASFSGGDVSSDGGVMVLRQVARRLGLVRALDAVIADPRHPDLVTHGQLDLLRQRIYGIALGYEDLNYHDTLRKDLAWQSAVERDEELASSPTLCRHRKSRRPADGGGDVAGARRAVHRELQGRARRADPRFRRDRRSRAWLAGRPRLPRLLRRLVFPAALRFLRRTTAGELPASEPSRRARGPEPVEGQYRRGPARARDLEAARHAPAPGVAWGEDHLPRRQRFLPLENAALVRAPRRGLPRGTGEKRVPAPRP